MLNLLKKIERIIIGGILFVMAIILILAFIDIVFVIQQKILAPPVFFVSASDLMGLLSLFLVLLIGLELLETVKAYLKDDIVHVEFIILVAIIAIARKVIIWDFNKYSIGELLSLSGMMLVLGITYFLIKKADVKIKIGGRNKDENVG